MQRDQSDENLHIDRKFICACFDFLFRTEANPRKSDDNSDSKKVHHDEPDDIDDEKQVEKPLLESPPETEIKQPRKKVNFN